MTEKKRLEKEEIKNGIKSIMTGLQESRKKEASDVFGDWLPKVLEKHQYLDITKPEHFAIVSTLNFDQMKYQFAETAIAKLGIDHTHKNYNKIFNLFCSYKDLERHIKLLFVKYEGPSCETDKSRWLLNAYKNYLLTDDISEREANPDYSYTQTEKGTVEEWLLFIDTISSMTMGLDIEPYIEKRMVLERLYQEEEQESVEG